MKSKTLQNNKINNRLFLLTFMIAGLLSSCAKSESSPGLAVLSVTHASPGLPAIDFYINGNRTNGDSIINYTDTLAYKYVTAGTLAITVKKNISATTYIGKNIAVEGGKYYSFFIIGRPDAVEGLLTEDMVAAIPAGKASLRFLNLSPDAPNLDFKLTPSSTLFAGQAYKSYTDYTTVNPGDYTVGIYEQGKTILLAQQTLKIEEGRYYTVWAGGLIASANTGTGLSIQAISVK